MDAEAMTSVMSTWSSCKWIYDGASCIVHATCSSAQRTRSFETKLQHSATYLGCSGSCRYSFLLLRPHAVLACAGQYKTALVPPVGTACSACSPAADSAGRRAMQGTQPHSTGNSHTLLLCSALFTASSHSDMVALQTYLQLDRMIAAKHMDAWCMWPSVAARL